MLPHLPALIFLAASALAWDNHAAVTRLALSSQPGMDIQIPFEPLDRYLAASGAGESEADFMRRLRLNPAAGLPFVAGEGAGATLSLGAILARYSDEPDWGFDADVFQLYPDLWRDDYSAMGGRERKTIGTAVRHAYWVDGYFKFNFPFHSSQPIGEAPQRAQLFFEQSVLAFRSGHPYWGARFLAWSMHYVQDAATPVHAAQILSVSMLRLDPEDSVRLMSYYHYAFERCASEMISGRAGEEIARRIALSAAVAGAAPNAADAEELARMTAQASALQLAASMEDIREFLPEEPAAGNLEPAALAGSEDFGRRFDAAVASRPESLFRFRALMQALLQDASLATRALVEMTPKEEAAAPMLTERRPF